MYIERCYVIVIIFALLVIYNYMYIEWFYEIVVMLIIYTHRFDHLILYEEEVL